MARGSADYVHARLKKCPACCPRGWGFPKEFPTRAAGPRQSSASSDKELPLSWSQSQDFFTTTVALPQPDPSGSPAPFQWKIPVLVLNEPLWSSSSLPCCCSSCSSPPPAEVSLVPEAGAEAAGASSAALEESRARRLPTKTLLAPLAGALEHLPPRVSMLSLHVSMCLFVAQLGRVNSGPALGSNLHLAPPGPSPGTPNSYSGLNALPGACWGAGSDVIKQPGSGVSKRAEARNKKPCSDPSAEFCSWWRFEGWIKRFCRTTSGQTRLGVSCPRPNVSLLLFFLPGHGPTGFELLLCTVCVYSRSADGQRSADQGFVRVYGFGLTA